MFALNALALVATKPTHQLNPTTQPSHLTMAPTRSSSSALTDPGTSVLPVARVHKIIKADEDIRLCSKEAIFLISKLTVSLVGAVVGGRVGNESYGGVVHALGRVAERAGMGGS